MQIRRATLNDIDSIAYVENTCFPVAEAATYSEFESRLKVYASHFWLLFEEDTLISFIDGFVSDISDLTDAMYSDANMHTESGAWQMIFGLNTLPAYRNKGYAGILIDQMIEDAKKQGRKGLVLTCKERLIPYYSKFGFVNEGISLSCHGNVTWYQMRYTF